MDYLIKTGKDPEDLEENVRMAMTHRWFPHGGVSISKDYFGSGKDLWVQAMVSNDPIGAKEFLMEAVRGCTICGEIGCNESLHFELEKP